MALAKVGDFERMLKTPSLFLLRNLWKEFGIAPTSHHH